MNYSDYIIVSDLDGTLTLDDGSVSKENVDAIKRFQSKGGIFTIASGRTPEYIKDKFEYFKPNAPIIALNGAMVYDLDKDECVSSNKLNNINIDLFCSIYDNPHCTQVVVVTVDNGMKRVDGITEHDLTETLKKYQVYKLVYIFDSAETPIEIREELLKKYGDTYNVFRSWPYSLEILDKDADKGKMLSKLNRGKDKRKIIAVGNFENDLLMFHSADIAVAVKDSDKCVFDSVDIVLDKGYKESAIENLIEKIEQDEL